jgi:exonuclease SbcC
MKILAIRGRNLASLADAFEIGLSEGALGTAGVFAITGPTGAGKSTILDAVCLALYDRYPRIVGAPAAEVGTEGIGANDPRSILRHGAAEGYAEVDFLGRDGRGYRARWQVRRARKRSDGRLQAQELTLADIDTGEWHHGTKTETLARIEDRVGLSFDQFRRSVLLAQGDFDAFLRAKASERAQLLELMTGTAIYSRISQLAFERFRAEQALLNGLAEQRARLEIMPVAARESLLAEQLQADADERRLADEQQRLNGELQWLAERRRLQQALAEAESALADARSADAAGAEDRARLALRRRAQPLLLLVRDTDRLAEEAARLTADHAEAQGALRQAETERDLAERGLATARGRLAQANDAAAAAQPLLTRAADLDSRIAEAEAACQTTADDAARASAHLAAVEVRLGELTDSRRQRAAAVERLERWFEANDARRLLAERSEEWAADIGAHAEASAQIVRLAAGIDDLGARVAEEERRLDRAAGDLDELRRQIRTDQDGLDALAESLQTADSAAAEDRHVQAYALADAAADLSRLSGEAVALAERMRDAEDARADADRRRAAATAELALRRGQLEALRDRIDEAVRAWRMSAAAAGREAEHLRAFLVAGEPCPVCGSREHPAITDVTALTRLVQEHGNRVEALESDRRSCETAIVGLEGDLQGAEHRLLQIDADAVRRVDATQQCRMDWQTAVERLRTEAAHVGFGLPALPGDPLIDPATETTRDIAAAADRIRCDAEDRVKAARQLRAEHASLLQRIDRLRGDADRQAGQIADQRAALTQDQFDLLALRGRADRARDEAAERCRRLDAPLAGMAGERQRLQTDPAALIAAVRTLAGEWAGNVRDLHTARADVDRLEREIAAASAEAGSAGTACREAQGRHTQAADRLDRLQGERRLLLDGRSTGEVRGELDGAVQTGRAAVDAAAGSEAAAAAARSRARANAETLAARMEQTAAALADLRAELENRAEASSISIDEARQLLSLSDAWVDDTQRRLADLAARVNEAAAVVRERGDVLQDHLQTGAPAFAEDAIVARLNELAPELSEIKRSIADRALRLAIDAGNRRQWEQLDNEIALQRQSMELWQGMSDLIGSRDGTKFRRFAQSLTLDRLLLLANVQLADLTPRYLLQRAPGGELELQVVDRDMGDEVRGISSLSGGERFLASLALALALASMSGASAIVESLFIDEGFGALDAGSLEVAISALEALQATGRKVGVISHVQTMVERIGVQVRVSRVGGGRSRVEVVVG